MTKLLTAVSLFIACFSLAQKNLDPTPEEIAFATEWSAKYPKIDLLERNYREKITFFENNSAEAVGVLNETKINLFSLSKRYDLTLTEGYDEESYVETFKVFYRNGLKAAFTIKDDFYKSDGLFYNDYRVKWTNIDFPVQGYNYFVETAVRYKSAKYFSRVYFTGLGLRPEMELEFIIPKNIEVELLEFNFPENQITKKEFVDESGAKHIIYTGKEILPRHREEDAPGDSYIYPHIVPVVKAITRGNKRTSLFEDGDAVYNWNKSMVALTKNKPEEFKSFVEDLVKGLTTEEEKIKKLYYWVQDNIRYIAFEDGIAGFKPDEAQNVFSKRYGDCKGMANLLAEMLKLLGYDARLAWIGTDHIAYKANLPSLAAFNHMICYLKVKDKEYFLDGTESYTGLGLNASRIQGKEALIESGAKPTRIAVPVSNYKQNKINYTGTLAIQNEKLIGTLSRTFDGEARTYFYQQFHEFETDRKLESLKNFLKRADNNIEIKSLKNSDLYNRDQTLEISYDVQISNKISQYDDEWYVEFPVFVELSEELFKDRKTDFMYPFASFSEANITIKFPEELKLLNAPKNFQIDKAAYALAANFKQDKNSVILHTEIHIKTRKLSTTDFENFRTAIIEFNKTIKQALTLKK